MRQYWRTAFFNTPPNSSNGVLAAAILNITAANIPKPAKESSRERVLSVAEARSIYQAAECLGPITCAFVRLLMLTGQRRSEISQLEWTELQSDRIEIGGHRSKNGKQITPSQTRQKPSLLPCPAITVFMCSQQQVAIGLLGILAA